MTTRTQSRERLKLQQAILATEMHVKGHSHQEIAAALGISTRTVNKHLQASLDAWQQRMTEPRIKWACQVLSQLRILWKELWEQWEKSKQDRVRIEKTRTPEGIVTKRIREGQCGSPALAAQLLDILKQMRDMLGLDAPKRSELSGPGGGPIPLMRADDLTDDQLARIAASHVDAPGSCGGIVEATAGTGEPVGLYDVHESALSPALVPSALGELLGPDGGG